MRVVRHSAILTPPGDDESRSERKRVRVVQSFAPCEVATRRFGLGSSRFFGVLEMQAAGLILGQDAALRDPAELADRPFRGM
jgi:hypothetical protein